MASPPPTLQDILDGPALKSPNGVYNFLTPSNINTVCFVIIGLGITGALIALCIRMYTKWVVLQSFHWVEDCTLFLGTAILVAYTASGTKMILAGAGVHQWDIQLKNISPLIHWINVEELLYSFGIPLTKTSILLQYLRIFTQIKKSSIMFCGCWGLIISMSIFYAIAFFFQLFPCAPRAKYTHPWLQGHCENISAMNVASGAFNVLTDIIIVLLPQYEIWGLQLSARKKVAVSAVFFAAIGVCILSILRLYYSVKALEGDLSYNVALIGIFAVAENTIGIICCCLPLFPRFFKEIGLKIFPTVTDSSTTSRPAGGLTIGSKSNNTWNTSSTPRIQSHRAYETLEDGHELLPVEKSTSSVVTEASVELPLHGVNDLRGIRMMQTFEVVSSPARDNFEEHKRVGRPQLGW